MKEGRGMVLLTTYITREQREALQRLSTRTRVRQSDYIREAIDDLLAKYRDSTSGEGGEKEELDIAEAVLQSGLSARTLRRYLSSGRLTGRKVAGRWLVARRSLEGIQDNVT